MQPMAADLPIGIPPGIYQKIERAPNANALHLWRAEMLVPSKKNSKVVRLWFSLMQGWSLGQVALVGSIGVAMKILRR